MTLASASKERVGGADFDLQTAFGPETNLLSIWEQLGVEEAVWNKFLDNIKTRLIDKLKISHADAVLSMDWRFECSVQGDELIFNIKAFFPNSPDSAMLQATTSMRFSDIKIDLSSSRPIIIEASIAGRLRNEMANSSASRQLEATQTVWPEKFWLDAKAMGILATRLAKLWGLDRNTFIKIVVGPTETSVEDPSIGDIVIYCISTISGKRLGDGIRLAGDDVRRVMEDTEAYAASVPTGQLERLLPGYQALSLEGAIYRKLTQPVRSALSIRPEEDQQDQVGAAEEDLADWVAGEAAAQASDSD